MKQIPKKNYYILAVLIVITILLTLSLASLYNNRDKMASKFYNYANKITSEEFDEYMLENQDLLIYISDKFDLSNEKFENSFEKKLDSLNLKDKLIYIDKDQLSKKFLNNLKDKYNIRIDKNKLPIIIVILDKKIIKSMQVFYNSDVEDIIDYGVFE